MTENEFKILIEEIRKLGVGKSSSEEKSGTLEFGMVTISDRLENIENALSRIADFLEDTDGSFRN